MRFSALVLLALTASAFAQETVLTSPLPTWGRPDFLKDVSGHVAAGYNSNMYERSSVEHESSVSGRAQLDYQLKGDNILRALLEGSRDEQGAQEAKLADGFIAWQGASYWRKGQVLSIGQHLRAIAPTSRESRKRDDKVMGVAALVPFRWDLTAEGLTGLTLTWRPSLTRNFHRYQQNRAYESNVEYSFGQLFAAIWSVTDHVWLETSLVYRQSWSYLGNRKDDNFEAGVELGRSWESGLGLAVGISNAGPVTRLENGSDQGIQLYDQQNASIYGELTYAF